MQIVKDPLFFGTIEKRLHAGFYKSPESFYKDVVLVFSNCTLYTKRTQNIYYHVGLMVIVISCCVTLRGEIWI